MEPHTSIRIKMLYSCSEKEYMSCELKSILKWCEIIWQSKTNNSLAERMNNTIMEKE